MRKKGKNWGGGNGGLKRRSEGGCTGRGVKKRRKEGGETSKIWKGTCRLKETTRSELVP